MSSCRRIWPTTSSAIDRRRHSFLSAAGCLTRESLRPMLLNAPRGEASLNHRPNHGSERGANSKWFSTYVGTYCHLQCPTAAAGGHGCVNGSENIPSFIVLELLPIRRLSNSDRAVNLSRPLGTPCFPPQLVATSRSELEARMESDHPRRTVAAQPNAEQAGWRGGCVRQRAESRLSRWLAGNSGIRRHRKREVRMIE